MNVIVTYYYEQSIDGYNRKKEEYFNRFSIWASNIQNNMIVFVQKDNVALIEKIRKKYIDKTKIIVIEKDSIDKYESYNKLIRDNISNSDFENSIAFRYYQHESWQYCSVWMLKIHFIYEASKVLKDTDNIIYIDFGLTELKNLSVETNDFDKLISFDQYDKDKINIFKYPNIKVDIPSFEYLEYPVGYIYACTIALSCGMASDFYKEYFETMSSCLLLGFNPVDQDILYILQRGQSNKYNLIELHENTKNVVSIVFDLPLDDTHNELKFILIIKRIYRLVKMKMKIIKHLHSVWKNINKLLR